ncbi:tripartite tricarboxylate transporter TctB family protein [Pelosinus baikalensis]|uniref:Tripartite tricarboxylate transporter TctB family protein n=1 Tax=Pelosinus baikalensis TaxID=2892015 RepID=A0ABS8HRU1_9FIRM|nr:tripartite tricarboxylate transporter TctB family protein [Pelosinus baikalensis]MCC5465890.1 tripartite tricarboxylate transporter TctB family protein [Pelosinus baikalensis]
MIEKIISLLFLIGSLTYLYWAQEFTFGTLGSPKSGFLPNLAGVTALLLSLLLMFRQFRLKKTNNKEAVDWTKFLFILIGLAFYLMILTIVGYFVATFIFLFYLFKVADTSGWRVPLAISFCGSAAFHLLFTYYLKVALP